MPSLGAIIATFLISLAAFVTYLYIFGIPPETKRRIENAGFTAIMGDEDAPASRLVQKTLNTVSRDEVDNNVDAGTANSNASDKIGKESVGMMPVKTAEIPEAEGAGEKWQKVKGGKAEMKAM